MTAETADPRIGHLGDQTPLPDESCDMPVNGTESPPVRNEQDPRAGIFIAEPVETGGDAQKELVTRLPAGHGNVLRTVEMERLYDVRIQSTEF